MKAAIRIVKRSRDNDPGNLKTVEPEKSVELSTREMVSTVKSWITELQQRKRTQSHSFSELAVIVPGSATRNG